MRVCVCGGGGTFFFFCSLATDRIAHDRLILTTGIERVQVLNSVGLALYGDIGTDGGTGQIKRPDGFLYEDNNNNKPC